MARSTEKVIHVAVRTEDDAALTLTIMPNGAEQLNFTAKLPSDNAAMLFGERSKGQKTKTHLLADFDPRSRLLRTFPISAKPDTPYLLDQKYSFPMLAIEDQSPISEQIDRENGVIFPKLPTGFIRDPFEGFGLVYPLRFIMEAFDDLRGIEGVILCKDQTLSRVENIIRFPLAHFDKVRRAINRAHNAALVFAMEDKIAYLRGELLAPFVSDGKVEGTFRKDVSVLRTRLDDALNKPGARQSRTANAEAAVRTVLRSVKDLVVETSSELYALNREIELVSLEELVKNFSGRIDKDLAESRWQKFLADNPFILRLAFGFPLTIFGQQVSVGGGKFDSSGGKLADYVVKTGLLGNLAIIEIKKPGANLLEAQPYRGDVFQPSKDLTGSVAQVLDQRFRLQQEINQKKINEGVYDIFAYSVQCVVIAGRVPTDEQKRKSFELYRSNLRDVIIITFDELLEKLKATRDFLASGDRNTSIEPALLGDPETDLNDAVRGEDDLEFEDIEEGE